jgi:hypothetical protein
VKPFRLSRRALLAGTGVGVALPLLDAMVDSRGLLLGTAGAQTTPIPPRLFTIFFPGGMEPASWTPTATGSGYTLTDSLMPLAGHRADMTVISGMNLNVGGTGDNHARGTGCFATAAELTMTASTGTSVDQVAQEELAAGRRTLVLALQSKPSGTFGGVTNTGDIYGEISWSQARGGVVEAVRDPARVFTTLFGTGPTMPMDQTAERARRYEQSILSYVRESTTRLQGRLGTADRQRLDAHLTVIRELEMRIASTMMMPMGATCTTPAAPGTPAGPTNSNYSTAKLRQMMDLMAVAMACDLSRFGSLMMGNGSNNGGVANRAIAGAELDEHSAAHDGDTPVRRYDQIRIYKRYQMAQVSYLLDRMASFTEGGSNVLRNSVVFVGSELSDPVAHSNDDMPIVVAGRAGGRIASAGSHVRFNGRPMGDLFLTLLRSLGSTATRIGNSTGTLPGILA